MTPDVYGLIGQNEYAAGCMQKQSVCWLTTNLHKQKTIEENSPFKAQL